MINKRIFVSTCPFSADFGHKKHGRLWEQLIFPYDKLKTAYEHWFVTPIQIVAELRDPRKLKKPKRGLNRVAIVPTQFQLGNFGITTQFLPNSAVDPNNSSLADMSMTSSNGGHGAEATSGDEDDETETSTPNHLVMDIKREPQDADMPEV